MQKTKQNCGVVCAVLLMMLCCTSVSHAQTLSEKIDLYRLARSHAAGEITLDQKKIDMIAAQGLAEIDSALTQLAQIPRQDMERAKKFIPAALLARIEPILESANSDTPLDVQMDSLVSARSSDCLTYVYAWLGSVPIRVIGNILESIGLSVVADIIMNIAYLVGFVGFWGAVLCLLGVI